MNYTLQRYYHLHMRIAPPTLLSADHVERKRHPGRATGGVPQTRLRSRSCGNRPGDPDSPVGVQRSGTRTPVALLGPPAGMLRDRERIGEQPAVRGLPRFLAEWISTSIARRSRSWERSSRSSRSRTSQRTTRIAVPIVPSPPLGGMTKREAYDAARTPGRRLSDVAEPSRGLVGTWSQRPRLTGSHASVRSWLR